MFEYKVVTQGFAGLSDTGRDIIETKILNGLIENEWELVSVLLMDNFTINFMVWVFMGERIKDHDFSEFYRCLSIPTKHPIDSIYEMFVSRKKLIRPTKLKGKKK